MQGIEQFATRSFFQPIWDRGPELSEQVEGLESPEDTPRDERQVAAVIELVSDAMEICLLGAAVAEGIRAVGAQSVLEVHRNEGRIAALARAIAGVDVLEAYRANRLLQIVRPGAAAEPSDDEIARSMSRAVRFAKSIISATTVEALELAADRLARPDLGHRGRRIYDRLVAFVRRHDASSNEHDNVTGRAYAEGRLSVDEVATLFGLNRSDAAARLEQLGYARHIDTVGLSDGERAQIVERVRADRIARGGAPAASDDLLHRDVVASQRIEGIDARPWLPPAKS